MPLLSKLFTFLIYLIQADLLDRFRQDCDIIRSRQPIHSDNLPNSQEMEVILSMFQNQISNFQTGLIEQIAFEEDLKSRHFEEIGNLKR